MKKRKAKLPLRWLFGKTSMTNNWTLTLFPIVTGPSKVNLIEYNAIGDEQFVQASPEAISAYTNALENNRISVTVRQSRGRDIDAACGQLANKNNEF